MLISMFISGHCVVWALKPVDWTESADLGTVSTTFETLVRSEPTTSDERFTVQAWMICQSQTSYKRWQDSRESELDARGSSAMGQGASEGTAAHTSDLVVDANEIVRKPLHDWCCLLCDNRRGVLCDEDGLFRLNDHDAIRLRFGSVSTLGV